MAKNAPLSLKEQFEKTILLTLQKDLKVGNIWAVPRVKMIQLNVGLGPFIAAKKDYSQVVENLTAITGQKPVVTLARKSISNFKIRENMPVGVTVTLRGKRMYDFLNKLINITFPRIRDFRGISPKGFDGKGNYTVGITETTVFPEINPDNLDRVHGLQITIVTSAKNNDHGMKLLQAFGFPFQKPKKESEGKHNDTISKD